MHSFGPNIQVKTHRGTRLFFALYKFDPKHMIKYVINRANYSTECCWVPEEQGAYPGIDKTLILDIHVQV
jgi:hypothetical protein